MPHFRFVSTMGGAPWGGSEELWTGAALRLLERGHEVTVHVYGWPEDPPRIAALASRGARVERRPQKARFWRRAWMKAIGWPLGRETFRRADRRATDLVVISSGYTLDGVVAMQQCRAHGWPYAPLVQSNGQFFWVGDEEAARVRECYGHSRVNFFVAHQNQRLLGDQLGGEIAGEVIANPFTVPAKPGLGPRAPDGTLRLACVARIDPVCKGQDVLLRVLAREKWRSRPVRVDFYGVGDCTSVITSLAARLGLEAVAFHGHVDRLERVWVEHDALVLPSRMEGTPLALIEAMLCSRPAIVTDVGDNARLVEDNVSGFVAKAAHEDLVDEALDRAWMRRDALGAMGAAARERVTALVPADPVGAFTARLLRLVEAGGSGA